ncbi:hypothetical protein D3C75_867010 [compost metagenome]
MMNSQTPAVKPSNPATVLKPKSMNPIASWNSPNMILTIAVIRIQKASFVQTLELANLAVPASTAAWKGSGGSSFSWAAASGGLGGNEVVCKHTLSCQLNIMDRFVSFSIHAGSCVNELPHGMQETPAGASPEGVKGNRS